MHTSLGTRAFAAMNALRHALHIIESDGEQYLFELAMRNAMRFAAGERG